MLLRVLRPICVFCLLMGGAVFPAPGQDSDKITSYTQPLEGTVVSFDMVAVPAHDGHPAFWVSQTEVTWEVYDVFVYKLDKGSGDGATVARPSKPYIQPGARWGHQGFPALAMTHAAATRFTEWLSAKTGHRYRLLREDEWETVCTAGQVPRDSLAAYAWHWDNADDQAHRVASRKPDQQGFYDLLGNVAEWVDGRDGVPVVKGGSFSDAAERTTCTARRTQTSGWNATDPQLPKSRWWLADAWFVGFRIARDP
jgi:formylglycine-generating enzyme required for sulfatase activity